MSYTLRPYQQEAVDLAIKYMRKNSFPAMLELATGSGKSIICAEIARIMTGLSGKKVLCLCPTAELVEQNHEKYLLTGNEASIYSASIGKSLRHDVVFATEGSFKSKALEVGEQYSTVILDECHRITPTIKKIIKDIQQGNPNIRVLGMSATPFRLGTGYIYEMNEHGQLMPLNDMNHPRSLFTPQVNLTLQVPHPNGGEPLVITYQAKHSNVTLDKMENAIPQLSVPILVQMDIGDNWLEAH